MEAAEKLLPVGVLFAVERNEPGKNGESDARDERREP
jgi:hypothetical protein